MLRSKRTMARDGIRTMSLRGFAGIPEQAVLTEGQCISV
jgi:hypothetical protein